MSVRTPSYRLHKPTGQAVVTIEGRDLYLRKHGSPRSRAEYDRVIAEWLANGRRLATPSDLSVVELIRAYYRHFEGYYRKDGEPTYVEYNAVRRPRNPVPGRPHLPSLRVGNDRLQCPGECG